MRQRSDASQGSGEPSPTTYCGERWTRSTDNASREAGVARRL
jgi:hypothetical protein